jgi:hypothetical protein
MLAQLVFGVVLTRLSSTRNASQERTMRAKKKKRSNGLAFRRPLSALTPPQCRKVRGIGRGIPIAICHYSRAKHLPSFEKLVLLDQCHASATHCLYTTPHKGRRSQIRGRAKLMLMHAEDGK